MKGGKSCGMSAGAQKATLKKIPKSTSKHKNPKVKPIGGKAMRGGKTK